MGISLFTAESTSLSRRNRITLFLTVPLVIGLTMIGFHFSGLPFLSNLIVPAMDGIAGDSYREFGLLENIQHLYLIVSVVLAGYGVKTYTVLWQKLVMGLVMCGFVFLFLEEIDYGRHYYDFFVRPEQFAVIRNLHN